MSRALGPVVALLVGVAIFNLGVGLQASLLPIRAQLESFAPALIGLMGSGYFVGFALGCVRGPWLVARVGHLRVFAAMVSLASCAVLLHAMVVEPAAWIIVRVATGYCVAILFMVTESWLGEKADPAARGAVFSVYALLLHVTGMLGQGSVAVIDVYRFDAFALGSVLITLAALPMLLARVEQPGPVEGARIAVRALWRRSPAAVVGVVGSGLANGAFMSLLPVAADQNGVAPANIALLMASVALAAAVSQWPIGLLSDRLDRRIVIALTCLCAAGAAVVLGLRPDGAANASMFGVAMAFGAFAFPLYTLCIALAGDRGPAGGFVETASGLLFVWSVGAVVGPILASALMTAQGGKALFAFTAACHGGVALYALWRMGRRRAADHADGAAFPDVVVAATTVSEVEPETPAPAAAP